MKKSSGRTSVILLLALIQGAQLSGAAGVQPSANPARAGTDVTLALSPPTALKSGSWSVGSVLILNWVGNQQAVFPSHEGRASVDGATGTLSLSSVTVEDSGLYVVQSTDPQFNGDATLTVLEAVSGIKLAADDADFVEFNSSAKLSCSSSGSSLSYHWLNGSSEVTASLVQIGDGGATLTIVNVTRYDEGPFRCNVTNAVSDDISQPLYLNVTYGPDRMSFTVNGLPNITTFLIGSNLTMSCSAQSFPAAQLQWMVKGNSVNGTGPELELHSVVEDQSGYYSCLAFNNRTNMYSNITKLITITKAPTSGSDLLGISMWLLPLLSLAGHFL